MTRLLTRENIKLGVVAIACLLIAWTGPSVAHGVHAKFAHNADKVDGKHAVGAGVSLAKAKKKLVAHNKQGELPDKFVQKPQSIVTTYGSTAWIRHTTGPSTFQPFSNTTIASGEGWVMMSLTAPRSHGSAVYGLAKVEICYVASSGGSISNTEIRSTVNGSIDESLLFDTTDRTSTSDTCYAVNVGKRVTRGTNLVLDLAGGAAGRIWLGGVRATWTRASATVAPRPSTGAGRASTAAR